MGERLLTIDRGNSTLDCLLHGGDEPWRHRFSPAEAHRLAQLWPGPPDHAVGCSVVAGGLDVAGEVLADHGLELAVAGRDLACPLQLDYAQPECLGVDRWVAALAAQREYGDAIVVDCGTAVTVDAVSAAGVFLGGAIAPGAAAMAVGLAACAPGLPAPELAEVVGGVPVTTPDAVRAGLVLGFCGAVDRLIDEIRQRAGMPCPQLLLTGGEAELYRSGGRCEALHEPDLVHRGLRWLWQQR